MLLQHASLCNLVALWRPLSTVTGLARGQGHWQAQYKRLEKCLPAGMCSGANLVVEIQLPGSKEVMKERKGAGDMRP